MSDDFEPDDIPEEEEYGVGDAASDAKGMYDDGKNIYDKGKEYSDRKKQEKATSSQNKQNKTQPSQQQAAQQGGKQAAKEGGKQAAQEGGKQAVKEGGKQAVKEGGKQVAKEGGKQAARAAAGAAAGAASGGITIAIEVGIRVLKKVKDKTKEKLNNAGIDVDEGKKNAKRIGCLGLIGMGLMPFIGIFLVIYLLVHQDAKTYDVSGTIEEFIECAETKDGCKDFFSTDYKVKGFGKRLIEFKNGPWNPFVADEVTDLAKKYIKFLKKYAIDDDAITFDFLDLGDIEDTVSITELTAEDISNDKDEKKKYNFKKKTMTTYFMLSATAFNNIEWIVAGPNDKSEELTINVWDNEDHLKIFGDRKTYREGLKSDKPLSYIKSLLDSRVKSVYAYDKKNDKFNDIRTKMDSMHVEEEDYKNDKGKTKQRKVRTGLRIPEVDHIGITKTQYLQMLEPILPAWIEPMMIYSATGDWRLAQRLYDFYEEALDDNPYTVGLYPIPTVTIVYIYKKYTEETSEIIGYNTKIDEDTGEVVEDKSSPIYKTVTYYGETSLDPDSIVDGEMYDISETKREVKCSYTAVLLQGYTYDFNVKTKWSIKFGSSSMGEPVTNSDSKTITQIDRYLIQSDGTEETPYEYTDKTGETIELNNRLEWYIMTHFTESQLIWDEIDDLAKDAITDSDKNDIESLKDKFKYQKICKNNVTDSTCSDEEKVQAFDYDIDSLAYVIQRCNEYYERVKKEVNYSTSISGEGTDPSAYLNYSSVPEDVFVWPVPDSKRITQCYGQYESGGAHGGIDIGNQGKLSNGGSSGPTVVAARGGTVQSINKVAASYGNHVVVDHGDGYISIYAHLYHIAVVVGQTVKTGDVIGIMGDTGNSHGVHLHFEIRYNWNRVNPVLYLYGIPEGAANSKNCEDLVNENIREVQVIDPNAMIVNTSISGAVKTLTKDELSKAISKTYSGATKTNLLSCLDQFIKIQDEYKVNAVFAVSVVVTESSGGTGWAAIKRDSHNWCSIKYYVSNTVGGKDCKRENGWMYYNSFQEATIDFGNYIKVMYFKDGLINVNSIKERYCPDEYAKWDTKVLSQMNKIYANAK